MPDTTSTTSTTRAWADGFGRWHASVPLTDNPLADANTARAVLIAALAEREGPQFDPSTVHVTRTHICTKASGRHTAVYSERIDD